jgi:glycosyltransferase involved in cell wall biosynthesis
MDKVTILTPCYNLKSKYIIQAIKSIIRQTYTNWELIIIDDASTDGTYEHIVKYLDTIKNNKIKLIRNNYNVGCYVSLNKGIQASTGKYITRLDSDDIYHRDKLKKQMNIIINNKNIYVVDCSCGYIKNGKVKYFSSVSLLYNRKIIDEIGYYDSVIVGADTEFHYRISKKYPKKIRNIRDILYYVNTRDNSLTTSRETSTNKNTFSFKKRLEYIRNARAWHKKTKNLYMPFPQIKRLFQCYKPFISKYNYEIDNIQCIDTKIIKGNFDFYIEMKYDEILLFIEYLKKCKTYFEYGCGGSTILASKLKNIKKIESVYNIKEQIEKIQKNNIVINKIKDNSLKINYIDTNRDKNNLPPKNYELYQSAIKRCDFTPDIIFIGGSFRISCAINCLFKINNNTILLMYNYIYQKQYHILEKLFVKIKTIGSLTVFKRRGELKISIINNILNKYINISE